MVQAWAQTSMLPQGGGQLTLARQVVDPSWQPLVDAFWATRQGVELSDRLAQALGRGEVIYPEQPLRALALTPLQAVRVVIVGQDPYHQAGQANGLAFSVGPGQRRPPSLRNILNEVVRDQGQTQIVDGQLEPWTRQGVLLLNRVLTVRDSHAASHAGWGWELLTAQILAEVVASAKPVGFLLWGAHAQALRASIDETRHRVWVANHPSPLSANRPPLPFMGCGHFTEVNTWLMAQGESPVAW